MKVVDMSEKLSSSKKIKNVIVGIGWGGVAIVSLN
jgi:hypothetical protein